MRKFMILILFFALLFTTAYTPKKKKITSKKAIQKALEWLKRHQNLDGSWSSYDFDQNSNPKNSCKNHYKSSEKDAKDLEFQRGKGRAGYSVGVTGLALLAYLNNGHSSKKGKFKNVVSKALQWLQKIQVNKPKSKWYGSIGYIMPDGNKVANPEWLYNHAIATSALCKAYGLTKNISLKKHAQLAIAFCVKAQNPGLGWRYHESDPEKAIKSGKNDTSVTGWMFFALKMGQNSGLKIPKNSFLGALRWFKTITAPTGSSGYMQPGGGSSVLYGRSFYKAMPSNTAIAVLCRTWSGESSPNKEIIKKGVRLIMNDLPSWEIGNPKAYKKINFYYWHYGTLAILLAGDQKNWRQWKSALRNALIHSQRKVEKGSTSDCVSGSWDPIGEWGIIGGRVYSTALGAIMLKNSTLRK